MQNTKTLYPAYITANSGFSAILRNSGAEYAEKEIPAEGSVHVGTIAFDCSSIQSISSACLLNEYRIDYDQRVRIPTGKPKIWWRSTGWLIDDYTLSGTTLTVKNRYILGDQIASPTSGDNWKPNGGVLYSGAAAATGGTTNLLGFDLYGTSDASFSYRLWMKNLRATVTYTQRYIARFYDENGTTLLYAQTLDANQQPTPPTVSRTGYDVTWKKVGTNAVYDGSALPSSVETDIAFQAVYTKKSYRVTAYPSYNSETPGVYIQQYVDGNWQTLDPQLTTEGVDSHLLYYGDRIRYVAAGYSDSVDLRYRIGGGAYDYTEVRTLVVPNGYPAVIAEDTVENLNSCHIEGTDTHYFTITTQAGAGGTITTTHRVSRTAPTTIYVQALSGYRIKTVKVDGVAQTIADDQLYTKTFVNVRADHSVVATFERVQYNITFDLPQGVSVTANGTAVSGNSLTVNHGDEIEFVFNCGDDQSLTGLYIDDIEDSLMDPVFKQVKTAAHTIYYVDGAHTLKATATSDLVTIGITQPNQAYGMITGETGKYIRQASGSTNTLTFTVTENVGYGFVKWDDDSTTRPLVFAPTADRTVSATFEALDQVTRAFVNAQKPYYKDATAQDKLIVPFIGGKISAKGQTSKDVTISAKTSDTTAFSFVADPGFVFESALVRYYDSADPDLSHPDRTETTTSNPFSLHDLSAKRVQIEADFKRLTYEVDVTPKKEAKTPDGLCSVSVVPEAYTDETYTDPKQYFFKSVLTLTATPSTGWYFRKWSDEGGEGKNVRTITVPVGGVELQAIFRKYTFEQHFTSCEGGSISIDGQSATDVTAEYGDNLLLTFTAEIGQKIKDVLLDGVSVFEDVTLTRRGGTYLLANITAAHTVAVTFAPRIYTNSRKLLDYYPPVIRSIVDIQRLMAAFQVENDAMWDAISFAMENQYIDTATEEGVSMWERELGIIPAATDTLNQRKARLRLKWVPSNNFTTKWLHGWLKDVCGADVAWPEVEGYTLKVTLPWFANWWTIFEDLKKYKPANIILDPYVETPGAEGKLYAGFAMQTEYQITIPEDSFEIPTESEESP